MARTRTTKKLAQRIDLNYFKRRTPYKRAKLWLCVLVPLLALMWIAWRSFSGDSRVYSSGRMSEPHAVLEKQCAACHVQKAGGYSASALDSACLGCHDGPEHFKQTSFPPPDCAFCHAEHRGRATITATGNKNCAICHERLQTSPGVHITSFEDGHPEFAVLRIGTKDPGTIKLNHAIHMKPIRRGPNGPIVQLECGDCHRGAAGKGPWPYADPSYATANASYKEEDEVASITEQILQPRRSPNGREYMEPVKFATACAACHLLAFDKRFEVGVPHDKPEVVHSFLVKKFSEYIAAHPAAVREIQEPERRLTEEPLLPRTQLLTPAQWVKERTAVAEELLWGKTCRQCHALTGGQLQDTTIGRWEAASAQNAVGAPPASGRSNTVEVPLPVIAPAKITIRWLPHAKFDHDAHRSFACTSCHAKALSSTETSDVLVPGIENCKTCHAPGPEHAESRCFECHTYHDWSKRKEVKPTYTLPALAKGGR